MAHQDGQVQAAPAAEYEKGEGWVVEQFGFWSGREMWAIPAWEEMGYAELGDVFPTREAAEAAIREAGL